MYMFVKCIECESYDRIEADYCDEYVCPECEVREQ
jgi:hypothetical protein